MVARVHQPIGNPFCRCTFATGNHIQVPHGQLMVAAVAENHIAHLSHAAVGYESGSLPVSAPTTPASGASHLLLALHGCGEKDFCGGVNLAQLLHKSIDAAIYLLVGVGAKRLIGSHGENDERGREYSCEFGKVGNIQVAAEACPIVAYCVKFHAGRIELKICTAERRVERSAQ